jgi:hypothetical protein
MRVRFTGTVRLVIALVVVSAMLMGCGSGAPTGGGSAKRSEDMTAGEFPESIPPSVTVPPPPMLDSPRAAVLSYLLWISYAYRVSNSEVASPTFSVNEEVGVNSYVQKTIEEGHTIDQRLVDFKINKTQSAGTTATLEAHEVWRYRYIDRATGRYASEPLNAVYDTVYTVVKNKDTGMWQVEDVKATVVGEEVK